MNDAYQQILAESVDAALRTLEVAARSALGGGTVIVDATVQRDVDRDSFVGAPQMTWRLSWFPVPGDTKRMVQGHGESYEAALADVTRQATRRAA